MINESKTGTVTDEVVMPRFLRNFIIISALIKLWLVGGQALYAIGFAGHDDRLFLNLAKAILTHGWFGHYSHMTLIKGPFYPFWIALTFAAGIPLLLSQHLLYIVSCVVFVLAVGPLFSKKWPILALWTILLFNPISYTDMVMTRVVREGIYPALTILVASCSFGILLRTAAPLKSLRRWAIGLGAALSALWLTREEGIWIMPLVLFISGVTASRIMRIKPVEWRRLALLCILPFAIWIAILGAVAGINKIGYGIFATVEVKSPDFLAAYGALSRVRHAHWRPLVPVPKETRERIYAVSPSFAELRPFIENDKGNVWISASCNTVSVCDDIAGGWFLWDLRDAVNSAGHYASSSAASIYYRRLAGEINAACREGRLDCGPERASLMPPWQSEYDKPFLNAMIRAGRSLSSFEDFNPYPSPSVGSDGELKIFRDLTHERLASGALSGGPLKSQAKFDAVKIAMLAVIGMVYQISMPLLTLLATTAYFVTIFSGGRAGNCLPAVNTAILLSIVARMVILSMIDVTSFPAVWYLYLAPAYPLLLMFVSLSLFGSRLTDRL